MNDYPSDNEVSKFTNSSRLFAFFRDFDKHISYVINLIGLVNVNLLTQENVSCLNTSLVIFITTTSLEEAMTLFCLRFLLINGTSPKIDPSFNSAIVKSSGVFIEI